MDTFTPRQTLRSGTYGKGRTGVLEAAFLGVRPTEGRASRSHRRADSHSLNQSRFTSMLLTLFLPSYQTHRVGIRSRESLLSPRLGVLLVPKTYRDPESRLVETGCEPSSLRERWLGPMLRRSVSSSSLSPYRPPSKRDCLLSETSGAEAPVSWV